MSLPGELRDHAQALVAARLGLDFSERRQADLERALLHACRAANASSPSRYLRWLEALPHESPAWRQLAGFLTVGETYFFRDRPSFEALEHEVLPSLIESRRSAGTLRLRLWSAGCATGEEPYSLGILLDRLLPDRSDWAITILATDIDPEALERARRGIYRRWSLRDTPPPVVDGYFRRQGAESFELDPKIRRMVTFAPVNLAGDGYPSLVTNTGAMDVILCRNVLLYFTREAQRATIVRLQHALVSGGWLAVSPTEASAELLRPLAAVGLRGTILYRKRMPDLRPLDLPHEQCETIAPDPVRTSRAEIEPPVVPAVSPQPPPPAEPNTTALPEQARAAADRGDLDEAADLCRAALAQHRLDPETYVLFAAICQERAEIPAALDALRAAIYLEPDSAAAHFLLGSLQFRHGGRTQGARSMKTAVSLLNTLPLDEPVSGADGLTARRLLETANAYMEAR